LLVVGRHDDVVNHVAGKDLSLEQGELALRAYQPVLDSGPVRVELVRAGSYSVGDNYDAPPDEEEE
jgi:hypothetical protein